MAPSNLLLHLLTSTLLLLLTLPTSTPHHFPTPSSPNTQKLSHLHFYFHDIVSGPNPTAIKVANAPTTNTSYTNFGLLAVIDDPLTIGPKPTSRLVGRAQGMYASASSQGETALLMALNLVFLEGNYNGSTLTVLGRNDVLSSVREMPVIAGSGVFRFASGFAQARTVKFDVRTGDAVVEYNVYVFHY